MSFGTGRSDNEPQSQSLWQDTLGDDVQTARVRHRLFTNDRGGAHRVDVAIVGGGFTGLWTARYLADADPSLRIAVLEAETCGFGASGRNGGWCAAVFPASHASLTAGFGSDAADAQLAAMRETVDEVGRAALADGIDCHFAKGGTLTLATNPAHVDRVRDDLGHDGSWLSASDARSRIGATPLLGAGYTPHCAALHPARLVHGLARAVEERGVEIFEQTRVGAIEPGLVTTVDGSRVRARTVLRCTEGYTPTLRGLRRVVVPIYSLMIATEPLSPSFWADAGLARRETFTDGRHLIIYGQRTADGRLAFGGRGAPYHYGSRIAAAFDQDREVFAELEAVLRGMFPALDGAAITHRWGGPLGVPRDWMASVGLDRATRVGWAGGYVGDGVATTNLAGRTLADLVLDVDSDLTRLPWVDHHSRRWEPEPFRWIGVNGGRSLAVAADRQEARTSEPARTLGRIMARLTGGH